MAGIIRQPTRVKKTSKITSKQVLTWAREVKAQRAQKVLIEAMESIKAFDTIKSHEQKSNTLDRTKLSLKGNSHKL